LNELESIYIFTTSRRTILKLSAHPDIDVWSNLFLIWNLPNKISIYNLFPLAIPASTSSIFPDCPVFLHNRSLYFWSQFVHIGYLCEFCSFLILLVYIRKRERSEFACFLYVLLLTAQMTLKKLGWLHLTLTI
jgi:hypothetical protein